MSKVYYIDCCDVCPNNNDEYEDAYCNRMAKFIPDDTTVPDWCPLPNSQESEESSKTPTNSPKAPICPACKSDMVIYALKLGVFQCDNCGEAWAGKLLPC